jgi:hypothetical protein
MNRLLARLTTAIRGGIDATTKGTRYAVTSDVCNTTSLQPILRHLATVFCGRMTVREKCWLAPSRLVSFAAYMSPSTWEAHPPPGLLPWIQIKTDIDGQLLDQIIQG